VFEAESISSGVGDSDENALRFADTFAGSSAWEFVDGFGDGDCGDGDCGDGGVGVVSLRDVNARVLSAFHACAEAEIALADELLVFDRRSAFVVDGARSPSSWLANAAGISHGLACRMLGNARRYCQYPLVRDAVLFGELSPNKAHWLLDAFTPARSFYADRDVALLIEHAARLHVRDVVKLMKRWVSRVEAELDAARHTDPNTNLDSGDVGGGVGGEGLVVSELFVSTIIDGVTIVSGTLHPGDGEVLQTAIDAAMRLSQPEPDDASHDRAVFELSDDPDSGNIHVPVDVRSPAQQRSDALLLIARFFLDNCDELGVRNGERPHVSITVDACDLATQHGHGSAQYCWDLIDMSVVNEWLCDCEYTRIVTGNSQVLDVGRKTRVIPLPLRKATVQRDQHCRFPGCAMPSRFTDIHHIVMWTKGGATDRDNCVSVCRFHHRLLHNTQWTMSGNANATLEIVAPDGTRYHSPPPPTYRHPTPLRL
jgi:hypothetical protein